MYVDFGGQGPTTYTQEVGSKQGDERMEGEREFHPLLLMEMMMKKKAVMNDL